MSVRIERDSFSGYYVITLFNSEGQEMLKRRSEGFIQTNAIVQAMLLESNGLTVFQGQV